MDVPLNKIPTTEIETPPAGLVSGVIRDTSVGARNFWRDRVFAPYTKVPQTRPGGFVED